ncbi:MAG TPA: DUF1080 domain-containing protein [Planctomycetota bacterium]|jgi:hypothetical protein
MRNAVLCLSVLLVVTVALRAADEIPPKGHPDSSKWENFYKEDLSDTIFPKGVWYIKDGELTADKDEAIWSQKEYENFIIDLEYKAGDAANSGVLVYCSDMKNWIPNSVEIQILDDNNPKWAKAEATWKCGAIFGRLAPSKPMAKKAGEWNRMTCTCKGQMLYVVLNGELVTTCDMSRWTDAKKNPDGSNIPAWLSKPMATLPTKGHIGLQGKHGGAPIFFRNVKIKQIEQ